MNNLNKEELELVFAAIRKYQQANIQDGVLYQKCSNLLNSIYDSTYTQQRQQVR